MNLTLSDAKKSFIVGKEITVIENNFKPERVGFTGIITKVQTNAFAYQEKGSNETREFWHWWGKATETRFTEEKDRKSVV